MPQVYTILSPALFNKNTHEIFQRQVVVIDVLRATTSMVRMLENGADEVIPRSRLDETLAMKTQGYLIAGERNGHKVEGFDFGNSPQEFTAEAVQGKKLALTTTNGTQVLTLCEGAKKIWIGSFLNLTATADAVLKFTTKVTEQTEPRHNKKSAPFFAEEQNKGSLHEETVSKDVVLFCAGWKQQFNLEDTVFAGAIAEALQSRGFTLADDASLAALLLWKQAKDNLKGFLARASHVKRFISLNVVGDLEECLKTDSSKLAISYEKGKLVSNRL
ncbi:MAG: 2-phosphosulfolactate phosphatase [Flavobacteriaceae bacterium]|nr:2-phosphosulfolactate phosphatase [Flavobacteriaceae bacterium]